MVKIKPMTEQKNKPRLRCPIVLLCERKEIAEFVSGYIRFLFKQGVNLPNLQIINLGNVDKLPEFLSYVEENEDIAGLRKIRLIADAGPEMRKKLLRIETIRNNSFLKDIQDFDCYLFPGKRTIYWSKGYLEDVLVNVLNTNTSEYADFANLINVSQDFLLSVNGCRGARMHLENYNRHLLAAYFAGTEKYIGLSIGELIHLGVFNLESEAFKCLQTMLKQLGE